MKTISVAFVAALSLAAFAGCNKKGAEATGASCEGVVAKMMTMQGAEMFGQLPADKQEKWKKQFSEVLVTSCKEDKWSPEILKCVSEAKDAKAVDECGKSFPKEQQEQMMKRLDPLMRGIMEDMGVGKPPAAPEGAAVPPPAEGAAPAAGGSSGVPECDAYVATFDKYVQCDKVPAEAKDATKKGLEAMKQGWTALKDPAAPAEAKKAAADACKQGEETLKKTATELGCTF